MSLDIAALQDLMPRPPKDRWALFLDIDGTLLEHAAHPDDVIVDDELRLLISDLEKHLDGALAFVTGRSVHAIDRLFAPLRPRAAGLYGLEHRMEPGGRVEAADEPADIAALAREIEAAFNSESGVFIERKGPVLAIHTRAAPSALAAVTEAAERALPRLPPGYRIVAGHAGIELMPIEAMKSAAIRRFMMERPFVDRLPVFIGDDTPDESGFEVINEAGGVSIRVRPEGPTAAKATLRDVTAAKAWLREAMEIR